MPAWMLFVILASATIVSAGSSTFTIDPSSVSLSQRATWCTSEINVCGDVCTASQNSCDPSTLDYDCACSDGTTPDMNEYVNSLPYFICEQAYENCITDNAGNAAGQGNCTTSIKDKCGTKNATDPTTFTTSKSQSVTTRTATNTPNKRRDHFTQFTHRNHINDSNITPCFYDGIIVHYTHRFYGLSTGPKIAIGVSVPLAIIILGLVGFLLYKRRRRKSTTPVDGQGTQDYGKRGGSGLMVVDAEVYPVKPELDAQATSLTPSQFQMSLSSGAHELSGTDNGRLPELATNSGDIVANGYSHQRTEISDYTRHDDPSDLSGRAHMQDTTGVETVEDLRARQASIIEERERHEQILLLRAEEERIRRRISEMQAGHS
ncbi:hypothetical protein SCAR479_11319 [Seiridium cardinale]|uniref:DUF7707 domain-containing protein n=1 Tax=Seiridium cardinale TaxID=138064 RepID=A0ABR2XE92_9PEZI